MIISTAKEVVKAGICEQNNSKSYEQILIKFSGNVDNGLRNGELDFGDGPDSGGTLTLDHPKIIGQDLKQPAM